MLRPATIADQLLSELSITQSDLINYLHEIARARGALVVEGNLDGSEARLNMAGKPAIITISKNVLNPHRKRFSIAHELGHLEMHRWKITLCTSADMMEWNLQADSNKVELEANEFAASFLMPERFFLHLCEVEPTFEYFKHIANEYQVSLTAASLRYCELTPEPVAIVYSQNKDIKWFWSSREFKDMGLFVNIRSRVYAGSNAALYFEGKTLPAKAKRIAADAWLRPGGYSSKASILEQSIPMDSYNAVLTLLWVDEDIEDEEPDDD